MKKNLWRFKLFKMKQCKGKSDTKRRKSIPSNRGAIRFPTQKPMQKKRPGKICYGSVTKASAVGLKIPRYR